mgnify:CR=1 FL=1
MYSGKVWTSTTWALLSHMRKISKQERFSEFNLPFFINEEKYFGIFIVPHINLVASRSNRNHSMIHWKSQCCNVFVVEVTFHLTNDRPFFCIQWFWRFLFLLTFLNVLKHELIPLWLLDAYSWVLILILWFNLTCLGIVFDELLNVYRSILSTSKKQLVILIVLYVSD